MTDISTRIDEFLSRPNRQLTRSPDRAVKLRYERYIDQPILEADMDAAFAGLADALEDLDDEDDEEVEEAARRHRLDEAGVLAPVIGTLLSMPKIMEFAGKAVDAVAGFIRRRFGDGDGRVDDESPSGTKVGRWLVKAGHELEEKYVGWIKKALTGLSKTPFIRSKLKLKDVDDETLDKLARIIFYAILLVAAGKSFKMAWKNIDKAAGAIEGALGVIKSDEILQGVRSLLDG